MTDTAKTPTDDAELSEDELAAQDGEELPERAAMSVVAPDPTMPESLLEDGIVENPTPIPKWPTE